MLASSSGSLKVIGKNISFKEDYNGSFGGFCKVVRAKKTIVPGYLAHFFQSDYYNYSIKRQVQGANINNLKNRDIDDLEIVVPSLTTQTQIATLLRHCEQLIRWREESIALLEEYVRSVFLEMFGDPVSNTKGLTTIPLGKLGKWKSGGTPSRRESAFFNGKIPWVTSGELNDVYISDSKEKITEAAIESSNASLIPIGSLMLGMYDTAALKSSINTKQLACNQAIAFSKLDASKVEVLYVYYAIQIGKESFRRMQRGVRQKNLNLTMIRNLEIPLPSPEDQKVFSGIISKIFSVLTDLHQSLTHLRNLYASHSQRAFRGELDPEKLAKFVAALPSSATLPLHLRPRPEKEAQVQTQTRGNGTPKAAEVIAETTAPHLPSETNWQRLLNEYPIKSEYFKDVVKALDFPAEIAYEDLRDRLFKALEEGSATLQQVFDAETHGPGLKIVRK